MTLWNDLHDFLTHNLKIDTVAQRRALLQRIGFSRLQHAPWLNDPNEVFCSELLLHLHRDGRDALSAFLLGVRDACGPWGAEDAAQLDAFRSALDAAAWDALAPQPGGDPVAPLPDAAYHVFISHATVDDAFVKTLRRALEEQGVTVWVDSRNLRGGDRLRPETEDAVASAHAVLAVISQQTFNSRRVRDELRHAAAVEERHRADGYRVIPLLLPGVEPSALWIYFDDDKQPLAVRVAPDPVTLATALPNILAALGRELPDDPDPDPTVVLQPVAELLLALTDPRLVDHNGAQRAAATATLTYTPAGDAARAVVSRRYTVSAPLGPIELEEIRWYLEQFALWPVGVFAERAARTAAQLPEWGAALYAAALGADAAREPLAAWRSSPPAHRRTLSIYVDQDAPDGSDDATQTAMHQAATALLALPWELLHDGGGYLLHGAQPVRIRRRLPNRRPQTVAPTALPIRILLLSPRPELTDDGQTPVGYIDHRASALPLVQAVENLGALAALTVLHPPTLPALQAELQRARDAGDPYEVLHFDGHGVYDRRTGLGALLFEASRDADQPGARRAERVHADKVAAVLRDHAVPLVFLEACQSGLTEDDMNSVATRLLAEGVSSVVAMAYSVLVETARRYVEAFYGALAQGGRVGAAHLAGQRALAGDTYRIQVMGAGDLHLTDWFVPVLYQDAADPQLFGQLLPAAAQRLQTQARARALGALPETPPHTFIGRSRELLGLERLLRVQPYAVVRGTGGAGKTTLAVELARWLVRSGQWRRAAFISLEQALDDRALLDKLGRQLLPDGDKYSVAQFRTLDEALQPVARVLRDDPTVIVIDNVESVLALPGGGAGDAVGAGLKPAPTTGVWALCRQLLAVDPATRLVFTSRERLPAPFDGAANQVELGALSRRDAIALVERVLANAGQQPAAGDAGRTDAEVTALVEAVNRHARALVLLAPEVARRGVTATTANLTAVMADLDARSPGDRENSLYASLELSLRRLPDEVRGLVDTLAVFHGGFHLSTLAMMLLGDAQEQQHFQQAVVAAATVSRMLVEVGLAEPQRYNYLRLDPALGGYLRGGLDEATTAALTERWAQAMMQLVGFLYEQQFQDAQLAAQLTLLELPNLLALLDWLPAHAAPERVVAVAGRIEQLLAALGQAGAVGRAVTVREEASGRLGDWGSGRFTSEAQSVERLLAQGEVRGALGRAQALLQRALAAGEDAYGGAAYDLAMAHWLLGRVLWKGGQAGAALGTLAEAQRRFEALAAGGNASAARMASVAITERATCLSQLGRLDEAAAAYEEAIARYEQRGVLRDVAVGRGQLGTVRLQQRRYGEALAAYAAGRAVFERLGEPAGVATLWHQTGVVHKRAGEVDSAEHAYRQALAIHVQHNLRADQAATLGELGNLYDATGRLEEAVTFYRQSADLSVTLGDQANEGRTRNNIAATLVKLSRHDPARLAEARREIERAIECKQPLGHAGTIWNAYNILHNIETADGNPAAAQTAWRHARDAYLAYRRDGGYAQTNHDQICIQVARHLEQNDLTSARKLVADLRQAGWTPGFLDALDSIINGNRSSDQIHGYELGYTIAVELLLLLERLAPGA